MSIEALKAEIKRNTGVLEDIEGASDVRIAYKTADGWKRLLAPALVETLRTYAVMTIGERLATLVPPTLDLVIDKVLTELAAELNDR
jgi:hypothetical protein